jgi:hypothetical protein
VTLLSGTLAELDLPSLAAVTSLGRTSLRLEVDDAAGQPIGHVVLKAGRVISASAGPLRGRSALRQILGASADARFHLRRETLDLSDLHALAAVDKLPEIDAGRSRLAQASTPPPPPSVPLVRPAPRETSAPFAMRPGTSARVRMMEGGLDEFDLATLLQVMGMGRNCVEIEILRRGGGAVGKVWVKSGKLVAASAGPMEGIAAISELLTARDGFQFAAFRVDADLDQAAALANISELILSTEPRDMHSVHAESVPIMEGSLADFDVATLLQTVAGGRQHCVLELRDDRDLVGMIRVKAAMVLSASAGSAHGLAALRQLLSMSAPHWFRLLRISGEVEQQHPLGTVSQLLIDAGPPVARPPMRDTVKALPPVAFAAPADAPAPAHQLVPLLDGNLADFELRSLLETMAMTRQHVRVQILDGQGLAVGEVQLKAGRFLAATAGTHQGTDALQILLALPRLYRFLVLADLRDVTQPPIELLGNLLAAAPFARAAAPPEASPPVAAESSTKYLWAVIPISFAVGGVIVFFLARRPTSTDRTPRAVVSDVRLQPPTAPRTPDRSADRPPPAHSAPTAEAPPSASPPTTVTAAPEASEAPAAPPPAAQAAATTAAAAPPSVTRPAVRDPDRHPVAAPPTPPAPTGSSRGMSVRNAQTALSRLGYRPGPADNKYGRLTRSAILQFQTRHHLQATGLLDRDTWSAIVEDLTR